MKKRASICIITQFKKEDDENIAEDDDDYYLHELNFNLQKNLKKNSFRKYYTSDLAFILGERESFEDLNLQSNEKNANSLKNVVKNIHQQFIQPQFLESFEKRFTVPEFIRQRDQKKKEMMKIIQYNEQEINTQKNKNKCQAYFIEIILIMAILMMGKKIFENFKFL